MLWGGKLFVKEFPVNARSLKRVIELAEVSCQTCAVPLGRKFVNPTVAGEQLFIDRHHGKRAVAGTNRGER
jgi:hypothetical protein